MRAPSFSPHAPPEDYVLLRSQVGYKKENEHVLNIEGRTVFIFRVRACSEAILELTRKFGEHTAGTPVLIRVVLGEKSSANQISLLQFVLENGEVDLERKMATPDILLCDSFKTFWFSWKACIVLSIYTFNNGLEN